jgi:hypothetical protein
MTGTPGRRNCGDCRHFESAPGVIERGLPGLPVLGSAHAASRAGDGACARHDRYVTAGASCDEFDPYDRVAIRAH